MKKILFADDDPEIREVVRILLARDGYEVVEAVNGIEAVEKADHTIDLIILDVMMPGENGIVFRCGGVRGDQKEIIGSHSVFDGQIQGSGQGRRICGGWRRLSGETVFQCGVKGQSQCHASPLLCI